MNRIEKANLYRNILHAFEKLGNEGGPHDLDWWEYMHALETQGEPT